MIEINLVFEKTITNLAGNQYGKSIFEKQVKIVEYEEYYKIIFPNQIKHIATSFIQGFFEKFVETFGISGILEKVQIVSSVKDLKRIVLDCLI